MICPETLYNDMHAQRKLVYFCIYILFSPTCEDGRVPDKEGKKPILFL